MKLGIVGGVARRRSSSSPLILGYSSMFTVYQTQQALVVRLGEPVRVDHRAGPALQGAADRQRDLRSTSASSISRIAGAGSDRLRPEAARGRCLRALPHHRSAAVLPDGRLDRRAPTRSSSTLLNSALRRVLGEATFTARGARRARRADGAHPRTARPRSRRPTASRSSTCASAAPICRSRTARRSISACRPSVSARRPSSARRAASARRKSAPRADRDVTVLLAEATSQGRADPRRGRRRTQPHLRRGLRPGSGLLRVLPLDAGL